MKLMLIFVGLLIIFSVSIANAKIRMTTSLVYPSTIPGSKNGKAYKFKIPYDGCYKISATGATGAASLSLGGSFYPSGATGSGVFRLSSGFELTVVVGKYAADTQEGSNDAGAGGGSFVFTTSEYNLRGVLYVAGGGGGWGGCNALNDSTCLYNGQADTKGVNIYGSNVDGAGADCGILVRNSQWCGKGGAGWLSSGCGNGTRESCYKNWFNGKSWDYEFVGGENGGYGGGGQMGGGGYSGGYIGGGGSFVNETLGKNANMKSNPSTETTQHGDVTLEWIKNDNDC